MKKLERFMFLVLIILVSTIPTVCQQDCDFSISGQWQPEESNADKSAHYPNPIFYDFADDGTVTALSRSGTGVGSKTQKLDQATYSLSRTGAPRTITITAKTGGSVFGAGATSMEITKYDDTSFTAANGKSQLVRWNKISPNRYFVVLGANVGAFYDHSGPAFPMLIKIDGEHVEIEAVGTYSIKGERAFGVVPPESINEFMKERPSESNVMLRMEISPSQYDRDLKILRTWERRVREDALFYPRMSYLNNILLVKEVVENLNKCGEKIKLYPLNYVANEDWITEKYGSPLVPFNYFKELRRLNDARHVRNEDFPATR